MHIYGKEIEDKLLFFNEIMTFKTRADLRRMTRRARGAVRITSRDVHMRNPMQIKGEMERIERELTSVRHDLGWRGAMTLHPYLRHLISWVLGLSTATAAMALLAIVSNDVPGVVTATLVVASCVSVVAGSVRLIYHHEFSKPRTGELTDRAHLRREVKRLNTLLECLEVEHQQRLRTLKREGAHRDGELSLPADEGSQQGELTQTRREDP